MSRGPGQVARSDQGEGEAPRGSFWGDNRLKHMLDLPNQPTDLAGGILFGSNSCLCHVLRPEDPGSSEVSDVGEGRLSEAGRLQQASEHPFE